MGDEIDDGAPLVVRAAPGMSGEEFAESRGRATRAFGRKYKNPLMEERMPKGQYDRSKARQRGAAKADKKVKSDEVLAIGGGDVRPVRKPRAAVLQAAIPTLEMVLNGMAVRVSVENGGAVNVRVEPQR